MRYHNDYSPRYQEPYDIYEKAKFHMKKRRKEQNKIDYVKKQHNTSDDAV